MYKKENISYLLNRYSINMTYIDFYDISDLSSFYLHLYVIFMDAFVCLNFLCVGPDRRKKLLYFRKDPGHVLHTQKQIAKF